MRPPAVPTVWPGGPVTCRTQGFPVSAALDLVGKAGTDPFAVIEKQISADGVHKWPFDSSCPVSVTFLSGDGARKVRMNRHDYFEVLYVCSGAGYYRTERRLSKFGSKDLIVGGGAAPHCVEPCSNTRLVLAALFFDPDMIRCDCGSDSAGYLAPFLLQDLELPHVISSESGLASQVFELMLRIRSELPAKTFRSRLAVKTYLKMVLVSLVNWYAVGISAVEDIERHQRCLERLRPLFRFVNENCSSPVRVKDAARICGMSESYFMSFFRQATGLSFVKYLNRFRIERAQAMLANTDESMAAISQEVGFCDQSYFGTVFRRIRGETPASFRRRAQRASHMEPRISALIPLAPSDAFDADRLGKPGVNASPPRNASCCGPEKTIATLPAGQPQSPGIFEH